MEKCGFRYHHTEKDKPSPLGDMRTEHFMRLTKEEYIGIYGSKKTTEN